MKCSYYDIFWTIYTFMKFILVVYMCLAGTCESVYEQKLYDTKSLCEASGAEVKEYAMINFPQSSGEIYCLTEEEFEKYQNYYGQTNAT